MQLSDRLAGGFLKEAGQNRVDQCGKGGFEQRKAEAKRERHVLAVGFANRSGMVFEGRGQIWHVVRSFPIFRIVCCVCEVKTAQKIL